jgi:branched-chain amino acid transport system ATP-binding protein
MCNINIDMEQKEGLIVHRLSVTYGKVPAVINASLHVSPGEIVALIGPNAAGKTSLFQAIASSSRAMSVTGLIYIDGRRIDGIPTRSRWAAGLRLVPQGRQIFPSLTVEENLHVVADNLGVHWEEAIQDARRLFPQIFLERATTPAGNLSGGEQQMLALARVLIGRPRVLLLDEPVLGLARFIIQELKKVIRDLSKQGMIILLADQGLEAWAKITNRTYVIIRGGIVGVGEDRYTVENLLGIGRRTQDKKNRGLDEAEESIDTKY